MNFIKKIKRKPLRYTALQVRCGLTGVTLLSNVRIRTPLPSLVDGTLYNKITVLLFLGLLMLHYGGRFHIPAMYLYWDCVEQSLTEVHG